MSMGRPKILVTNDDGYASDGLAVLGEALRALGDVTVVAPEHDNSGIGHQITIKAPVRAAPVEGRAVPTYRLSGTPADCVVVGAFDLCGGTPALLVSGINRGANVGDDLNYSGTVAAAVEGTIIGVPSLAISLAASWPEQGLEHHWKTAADIAVQMGREILADGLPRLTLLNVNVPNLPARELRGIRWVRQGRKGYRDRLDRRTDPRGGAYYWLWGAFDPADIVDGTDLAAVRDGYVGVTPLSIDRTNHDELGRRWRERNARVG
ncbi:MAG: 5'/3'-nucleotidase SurE [Candidatus Eremiobacteraeota bacterium]|nr:5'/3'-nucleotidase SurE [Candidatus Eremiobacteraeota bacterium]MBC5821012.1 5'/3'-nucleotidase SurE [Candidatus Eremiobacteraeota bacterium]